MLIPYRAAKDIETTAGAGTTWKKVDGKVKVTIWDQQDGKCWVLGILDECEALRNRLGNGYQNPIGISEKGRSEVRSDLSTQVLFVLYCICSPY